MSEKYLWENSVSQPCNGTIRFLHADSNFQGDLKKLNGKPTPHGRGTLKWDAGFFITTNWVNGTAEGEYTANFNKGTRLGGVVTGTFANGRSAGPTVANIDGQTFYYEARGSLEKFDFFQPQGLVTLKLPSGKTLIGNGLGANFVPDPIQNEAAQETATEPEKMSIPEAKKECAEIGFIKGSDDYLDCVLELVS